jgi:pimeloyl-ACP methyl ester carboxylesterase
MPYAVLCALLLFNEDSETRFVQLTPAATELFERTAGENRAVVLIHGFTRHVRRNSVRQARLHSWQSPGSALVEVISKESDVYAFAYGQTVAVDEIAAAASLGDGVRRLTDLGYSRIVLVGHSAGGLVARQFVEDQPNSGVTKVIQVSSPNAGCTLAEICEGPVPRTQEAFLKSLTKDARREYSKRRAGKSIPPHVQFVSVVCRAGTQTGRLAEFNVAGDLVLGCETQWPADLQEQGIPAVELRTNHEWVMRGRREAEIIATLISKDQKRWDGDRTTEERARILSR